MSLSITGKLHKKFETQEVSDRFRKRDFVVEYASNPMYPQYINFQLSQDKVDIIDAYEEGEEIVVEFNLRGRKWVSPSQEEKYFNTLDAWRIAPTGQKPQPAHYSQTMAPPSPPNVPGKNIDEAEEDDLPF